MTVKRSKDITFTVKDVVYIVTFLAGVILHFVTLQNDVKELKSYKKDIDVLEIQYHEIHDFLNSHHGQKYLKYTHRNYTD